MDNVYIVVIGSVKASKYEHLRLEVLRENKKPVVRRIHAGEIPIKFIEEGDNCMDEDPFDFKLLRDFFGDPDIPAGGYKDKATQQYYEQQKLAQQLGVHLSVEHGFSLEAVAHVIVAVGFGNNLLPYYPLDVECESLALDLQDVFGPSRITFVG